LTQFYFKNPFAGTNEWLVVAATGALPVSKQEGR